MISGPQDDIRNKADVSIRRANSGRDVKTGPLKVTCRPERKRHPVAEPAVITISWLLRISHKTSSRPVENRERAIPLGIAKC